MGLDPNKKPVIQDIEEVNEQPVCTQEQEVELEEYDTDNICIGDDEDEEEIEYETVRVPVNKRKQVYAQTWKPANIMEIPEKFKDPNFTYYCANWKQGGRILKLQNEGWVIDKHIKPAMEKAGVIHELMPGTLQDGVQKDDTLRFRELVVLRMDKATKEARARYFREQNPLSNKLKVENKRFADETEGRSYGHIKMKRGG